MTKRVTITPGEALSMADELAAMRRAPSSASQPMSVEQGNGGRIEFSTRAPSDPVGPGVNVSPSGFVVRPRDPNRVIVNGGYETSRQVAETMGWVIESDPQPFHQGVVPNVSKQQPQDDAQQQKQQEPQDQFTGAIAAGDAAISNMLVSFPGNAEAVLNEAVATGDYDALVQPGISSADINAAVAGATAYADRVVFDAGVNVATMSEVLTDSELADARRAVVNRDANHLRALADAARNKLASWPQRDASGFKAFFNRNFGDIETDVAADGRLLVSVEGHGMVPWVNAVMMGATKIR